MNTVRLRSRLAVLVLASALAAPGALSGARDDQRPGGAGLVIDFSAVTADGTPVTDLTAADVTVRVGGRPRAVQNLELKRVEASSGAPAAAVAPPFATNEPVLGRSILIAIDSESLRPGTEKGIQQGVNDLLAKLGPNDRVAMSYVPRDTVQLGFGDPARVREAIGKFVGQRPGDVDSATALCRTRDSIELVKALIRPLAGNDAPTAVVFISAGTSTPGQASSTAGGRCEVSTDAYQVLGTEAAAARVNFYVVQGDDSVQGRNDGLELLTSVTSGESVLRLTEGGFASRVLSDLSSYWVATVAGDASDRPGQSQSLDVAVGRAGVTTHARARVTPAARASGKGASSPREMVQTTAAFTDLRLRALAMSSRGKGETMAVMVLAEPEDRSVKLTALSVGLFPAGGKPTSTAAQSQQLGTYPIAVPLATTAGPHRIRVAAIDANGRTGAVDITLDTSLTNVTPTLRLGSLVFLAPRPGGSYAPQMYFSDEPEIMAYVEMYGVPTGDQSARIELADSDAGKPLQTIVPAGGATNEPDKFTLSGQVPIANLKPGDYVVRMIVETKGQPDVVVKRTFRKIAK